MLLSLHITVRDLLHPGFDLIFLVAADVTLHKATFTNNFGLQPTVFGGATVIAQYGHLLNISHCTFTINSGTHSQKCSWD